MLEIDDGERDVLDTCLVGLNNWVEKNVIQKASRKLEGVRPAGAVSLLKSIQNCRQALSSKPRGPSDIGDRYAPTMKRALIHHRREEAERTDASRTNTLDAAILAELA